MITRKEELTHRLNAKEMAEGIKTESNYLKRKAKRKELKKELKKWYDKKYPNPKEL